MIVTRIDFIQKFNKLMEHALDTDMPETGEEKDMLEKAYGIINAKLQHIKEGTI